MDQYFRGYNYFVILNRASGFHISLEWTKRHNLTYVLPYIIAKTTVHRLLTCGKANVTVGVKKKKKTGGQMTPLSDLSTKNHLIQPFALEIYV